jgi:PPOX class probable F420-dependent enzyme
MTARLSAAVRDFLQEPRFLTLATINRDGTPQQSVIWYELQGDEIMMNTARGRLKDRNLIRDPRASICLEDGYRYLAIRGTVSLNADQGVAQEDIRRLSERYHGPEKAEEQMRTQFSQEERVTIRLAIERVDAAGF